MGDESSVLIGIAADAFRIESDCLKEAFSAVNTASFIQAVDLLSHAERIAASGCGHSGIACQHFAHLMCCIERPARFISPSEAVHGALGFVQKGDVMLLASRGGNTQELLPILEICNKKGVSTIAVTENMESSLAKGARVVLQMRINREVDKYNSQGTTSFTMLNVLFDSLQAAIIEKTGYQNKQFALIHPGGAVGQRLNTLLNDSNDKGKDQNC